MAKMDSSKIPNKVMEESLDRLRKGRHPKVDGATEACNESRGLAAEEHQGAN